MLRDSLRSDRTNHSYEGWRTAFETFRSNLAGGQLPIGPALVQFVVALHEAGRGGSARVAVAAVRARHDVDYTRELADVVKAAMQSRRRVAPRSLLPKEAVRDWCEAVPQDEVEATRDRALLLLGLRLMLRPSELVQLRLDQIAVRSDGVEVRMGRRKADQLGEHGALPTMVDPAEGSMCPVAALEAYLRLRGNRPGPLFCTRDGRALQSAHVGSVVAAVAARGGLQGRWTGHCLRIAGASWAAAAGASIAEVQAVGGWASEAFLRYLHATSAAAAGLSARMMYL